MLLRRVAADDGMGSGSGAGRPRLFAAPRLLVGLGAPRCGAGAGAAPDRDSPTAAARSPTSPLDLRAPPFAASSLLRSPRSPRTRSWDSHHRLGLGGLVDDDALADHRLLAARQPFKFELPQRVATHPRDCAAHAAPELGNAGTAAVAVAGCKSTPVPCSRSYGEVKSGPEVAVPGAAAAAAPPGAARSHPVGLGKFPLAPGSSLPASIGGGPRRYLRSVSATELEQSEDYTCIIAHGPNPKTTRIFGDCILEPCTLGDGGVDAMEVKEGAESYWLVKCFDDGETGGEEFLSSCASCKKKLDGNDSCIFYRGEKAFGSRNCRDQEVLTTEEEENITAVSSLSSAGSSSSFNDDIFMAEMVVLAAPVDGHYP